MPALRILIALALALIPAAVSPQDSAAPNEKLWTWFGTCTEDQKMGIEMLLDGKTVYRSSFPICQISDRSKETDKSVAFTFKGGHNFQGEYHTTPAQTIEGDIWQADADTDDILLGISFTTRKQILLNTIHIARPDRVCRTEIDRGIVVRTFPVGRK